MDQSVNAPTKVNPSISKWVWYETNEALLEGQAVCYNYDYTGDGATYADARRMNHVEKVSATNAQWFAGVASAAYSAKSGGQLIKIYVPGSVCNIHLNASAPSTVVGQGLLTFDVTSGYEGQFLRTGMPGVGSAIPLQTTTTGTAQKCLALLQKGPPSGGVELVALAGGAAFVAMVGGTTLCTGYAAATDASEEIVDGLIPGIRKKIVISGTAISGGGAMIINILNNDGITLAGGALASLTYTNGAIGAGSIIEWRDGAWYHVSGAGFVEA